MMTQKKYNRFIRSARRYLYKVREEKFKHICIIFKGSRLYVVGYNSSKTHPKSTNPWLTMHAEADAIIRFSNIHNTQKLSNMSILILRFDTYGSLKMSKPCEYCEELIRNHGITKIFYSTGEGVERL